MVGFAYVSMTQEGVAVNKVIKSLQGLYTNKLSLRVKIITLLLAMSVIFLLIFSVFIINFQHRNTESEIVEQCRMLDQEMDAVLTFARDNEKFIEVSEESANPDRFSCAMIGESVAVIFSKNNEYTIRFTWEGARNPHNVPDDFELEGFKAFKEDARVTEYYGKDHNSRGEAVYRYMSLIPVEDICVNAQGELVNLKTDGDYNHMVAATSISVPLELYRQNEISAILSGMFFFVVLMAGMVSIMYVALNRMVTKPLNTLNACFDDMKARSSHSDNPHVNHEMPTSKFYSSKEMSRIYDSFDELTMSLDELYRNMDSQVKLRTNELYEANKELREQRKQVEDMVSILKKESQYKSDFLAIVSHELRTPLTSILAFTDLLEGSIPPENEMARKQLNEIAKSGAVLLEMVNNVLETARIQAGSEKLMLELVELSDVVGMVEEGMASLAAKKSIDLTTFVYPNVPLMVSDWEKLRRILVNLVSNAIKFTPQNGKVDVKVTYNELQNVVVIRVSDSGIGIAPENHDLIFERFTQENMTTSRRYGGSGLGLSLVKDLVIMLHGTIHVESELGEGAVFTVTLPVQMELLDSKQSE